MEDDLKPQPSAAPFGEMTVSDEPPPLIPYGWVRCLVFLLAFVILTIIQGLFAYAIGARGAEDAVSDMTTWRGVVIGAFVLLSTALLILAFRGLVDRRPFVSLGFSLKGRFKRDLFVGIAWGVGLITAVFLIELLLVGVKVTGIGFPLGDLLILLLVLIMAAIYEELLLRGYLLNNLMQSVNKYLALILISVVFASFHGFNPNVSTAGLINIILAGLLLGVYYIHRQNLWLPITTHIFWNYFQGPIYGSPVSGTVTPSVLSLKFTGQEWLTGGHFGFEASVVGSCVLVVGIVVMHLVYRKKGSPPAQELQPDAPRL